MTQARLVERIEADLVHVIETAHGPIRAMTSRGPHLAAAALGFADEEPELLAWIDGFPKGARFWDVGAATGLVLHLRRPAGGGRHRLRAQGDELWRAGRRTWR